MHFYVAFGLLTIVSAANICAVKGMHDTEKLSFYMLNFFSKGPSTFALCASWCKNDSAKCKSFRYSYWSDAAAQYCEFFEYGLEGNITADSNSPYWYYDIGCAFPTYAAGGTVTVTSQGGSVTVTQTSYQVQTSTQTITSTSVPPPRTITTTSVPAATTQTQTVFVTTTSRLPASTQTSTTTLTQRLDQNSTSTLTFRQTTTISTTLAQPTTLTCVQPRQLRPSRAFRVPRRSCGRLRRRS
ncbi:hypothetical protein BDU57DRAFT_563622 [Ampelomyces quisqualis]|uniref:Apple domain-containing protein n=1 Tax=Ampelomyces quisqualis TaxID=50730 RepID=A0A6A5R356_AMPQU|nr:hypothetical protein BDU57DRAFT_563622 [Ampelomyces quisqualis]